MPVRSFSGEAAFQSANSGFYGNITCLSTPSGCIANYSTAAPTFLDGSITALGTKQGYARKFTSSGTPTNPGSTGSIDIFCYGAKPSVANKTGVRTFGADDSGVVGVSNDPATDCCAAATMAACLHGTQVDRGPYRGSARRSPVLCPLDESGDTWRAKCVRRDSPSSSC
jgi:hypothetical protein